MKQMYGVLAIVLLALSLQAQTGQTIRGKITDEVAKIPLIGVNIVVVGAGEVPLGSATDENGDFRINNVPLGRQTIRITYIGYDEVSLPNIVVTAGKEVILNISLTESINQLQEIVVTANVKEDKTATNNELAMVSSRSFNVDDTKRYAGALGDPSRMAANFAGVVGGNDSRNDIVVRGNSPAGMLWQLEGLNIPNPNHFGALVSTGGPVSMLNNNNLDKSDFLMSAFPAQYGNATSGVFDLKLRDGNNQKKEFVGQIGFAGVEVGAEGPLSKNSKASYIANYRYSTLAVFNKLGIKFGTGSNTPLYQDINFKISMPTAANNGKWTLFGIGGTSAIDLLGSKISKEDLAKGNGDLYGNENEDSYPRYRTGILGLSYEQNLSSKTFVKFTAGISATEEKFTADSLVRNAEQDVVAKYLRSAANMKTTKSSFAFSTRTKFSSKNSLVSGLIIDATTFNLVNEWIKANLGTNNASVNIKDNVQLYQAYSIWKHRFNNKLSFNAGLHGQYYSLSGQSVVQPRVGVKYQFNGKHALSAGYGLNNQTQNILTSFVQTRTNTGVELTNKNLKFSTSQHYVVTYDWNLTNNLRVKAEAYFQTLSNVPVETNPTSFSAINTGISFAPSDKDFLVSKGKGTNKGIELTIERFFDKGFYFLITTSLFDSKYKGSDGIERNTAYNTKYVTNALVGREWKVGRKGNFLSVNLKGTTIGGRYLTPVDFAKSQAEGRAVYNTNLAFSEKQTAYFRTDIKIAYRQEYKRSTLESGIDLQNVTAHKNIFSQDYNPRTNSIVTNYQQGFFPVPFVRFTF